MRTKGSVSSVPVSLAALNQVLKPNAEVMVSKKFYDAIAMLIGSGETPAAESGRNVTPIEEEQEAPIHVETL